jgi:hypothetical protein
MKSGELVVQHQMLNLCGYTLQGDECGDDDVGIFAKTMYRRRTK